VCVETVNFLWAVKVASSSTPNVAFALKTGVVLVLQWAMKVATSPTPIGQVSRNLVVTGRK